MQYLNITLQPLNLRFKPFLHLTHTNILPIHFKRLKLSFINFPIITNNLEILDISGFQGYLFFGKKWVNLTKIKGVIPYGNGFLH